LATAFAAERQTLVASAESAARVRHLRLHLLSDENAVIPLIGTGRRATLAANGIVSAADISRDRVFRVYGFGEGLTGNLLAWQNEVLHGFRFDATRDVSASELATVTERHRIHQRQLIAEMETLLVKSESAADRCRATLDTLFPQLRQAALDRDQADADMRHLTGILPT